MPRRNPDSQSAVARGMAAGVMFLASIASGGSITTLDGRSYEGDVHLDADAALTILPRNGSKVKIDLTDVLKATFAKSADDRPLLRGVVLTNGEAIAAEAVTRMDDNGVRIVRAGGVAETIANDVVARVIFRPISAEILKRIPSGHGGAILTNGDFFEGDVAGCDGNSVKISSVLFGIRSFDTSRDALGVVLHDADAPEADCVVRLMNGSVLRAKSISVGNSQLTAVDEKLGKITVNAGDLLDLRVGGGAFETLGAPDPTAGGSEKSFAVDRTPAGVPITLYNCSITHGIGASPGVSLTWNLGGKYKSLMARAGVPIALVPVRRLQFVVLADGKEVFRSSPRSSVDDPSIVGVSLSGVQTMTLRIDGADANTPGATGVWGDPILVRVRN